MQMLLPFGVFLRTRRNCRAASLVAPLVEWYARTNSDSMTRRIIGKIPHSLSIRTDDADRAVPVGGSVCDPALRAHAGNSGRSWSNPAGFVHRDSDRQFALHSVSVALAAASLSPASRRSATCVGFKQVAQSQDEAEFVLETFQSVVAQLQEQRKELEQLSVEARERASSAEKFSERIVASLPSGLIAFDGAGLSMAVNTPGRTLLDVTGAHLGSRTKRLLADHASCRRWSAIVSNAERFTGVRKWRRERHEGELRRLGATIAPIELPAGTWTERRVLSVD